MAYEIKQRDRDILFQSSKVLYSKVELLNRNFKVIDKLEGNLISDSYTIDAASDTRRVYSCQLHVNSASFFIGQHKILWFDHYIRPYVGIRHLRSGEIQWYLMGTYSFINTNYTFQEQEHTLSLDCEDLTCMLNNTRNGQLEGVTIKIEAGENAYEAIAALLKEAYITSYLLQEMDYEIPEDMEWEAGTSVYEMLKDIVDLYAGYEMGFDIEGTFFIRKIPQSFVEPFVLDHHDIDKLLLSESTSMALTNIYNRVQVWGQVIKTDRYTDISSLAGSNYNIILEKVTSMEEINNFEKIAVRIHMTNPANATLSINGLEKIPITDDAGNPLAPNTLASEVDCAFKYRRSSNNFYYIGQYQVFAESVEENPESPFHKDNLGFELLKVCQGDEYVHIYSDDLAKQRANYEIWLHTIMSASLNLNIISIPWLDVNQKIEYASKNQTETKQYIIKSISGSTSEATQTINCVTFYPNYKYR